MIYGITCHMLVIDKIACHMLIINKITCHMFSDIIHHDCITSMDCQAHGDTHSCVGCCRKYR